MDNGDELTAVLVRMPKGLKSRFDGRVPVRHRAPLMRELVERWLDEDERTHPVLDGGEAA
jgi:hypothetical protein